MGEGRGEGGGGGRGGGGGGGGTGEVIPLSPSEIFSLSSIDQ